MSLKSKVLKGSAASVATQIIKFPVRMASIAVLARYLQPEDYGKVAIVAAISSIMGIFLDGGLSTAVLQKPEVSDKEQSSMFWLNVALGLGFFIVLSAAGPVVNWLYDDPDMLILLPCYGALGVFSSIFVQKQVSLQREMKFGRISMAELVSELGGVAIAIVTAIHGWGYWSLFAQFAGSAIIRNAIIYFACSWNPSFYYSHDLVKPMLKYGSSIMFSNLLANLSKGLDALLIGYFFGPGPVGLFNRAQNLLNIPLRQFVGPINNVARTAIFRKAMDHEALERSVAAILALISLGSALIIISSLSLIQQAVTIILGSEWLQCIPIFMALTPFAFVEPAAGFLSTVLISKGDSKPLLKWRFVSITIIVIGLCIGIKWGPIGMAVTYSASGLLIRMPMFLVYSCKRVGLSIPKLTSYIVPSFVAGSISAAIPVYFTLTDLSTRLGYTIASFAAALLVFSIILLLFPKGRKTIAIIKWALSKNGGPIADTVA